MLRYQYSLTNPSNNQEIILDDMYVSPDLVFVSGTTEHFDSIVPGKNVWVQSPYYPDELPNPVISREIVRRNGYIEVDLELPIHQIQILTEVPVKVGEEYVVPTPKKMVTLYFVEYKGNTYYSDLNEHKFTIDGHVYTWDGFTLTIKDKIYIENGKITVNGITYTTMINSGNTLVVYDFIGNVYKNHGWDTTNVNHVATYVEKLLIGKNTKNIIDCESIGFYGHRAYIIYNGEKHYIQYFYYKEDEPNYRKKDKYVPDGAGVIIDDTKYICDAICIENPNKDKDIYAPKYVGINNDNYNIYNINDYVTAGDSDNITMRIGGDDYIIYFEPCEIANSGIVGIETSDEYPSILIGDRLTIKLSGINYNARVNSESGQTETSSTATVNSYVYINGRKYDVINHLCDSITFGNEKLILDYTDNSYSEATCKLNDGTILYFNIKHENGTTAQRMTYIDGRRVPFMSMVTQEGGTVAYKCPQCLEVELAKGVLVGGQKLPISKYYVAPTLSAETSTNEDNHIINDTDSNLMADDNGLYYEYVAVSTPLEYNFKVINVVGSNRILCVPDVDSAIYTPSATQVLMSEIVDAVQDNDNFIVLKRSNSFGVTDLYYDTWANDAKQVLDHTSGGTSVYELAQVKKNIKLFTKSSSHTIPLTLSSNTSFRLGYEDLITNQYYNDEVTNAVNPLVDMEKDMYTPVIKSKSNGQYVYRHVDSITFNLHFRTRDMETWKIIEDRGKFDDTNLTADYQYCNYFITDYYPYNQYIKNNKDSKQKIADLFSTSDLLGFLYFTTDDVRNKREKLRKSFLRLTFFDSINPENQNMLGTSTLYLDYNRYFDTLYQPSDKYHYEYTAKSQNPDRISEYDKENPKDRIDWSINIKPTVLTECFDIPGNVLNNNATEYLHINHMDNTRLDSCITVSDNPGNNKSSEGYYMYILKEFAEQNGLNKGIKTVENDNTYTEFPTKTIYMKAEFFHAGLGLKIPMVVPTYENNKSYNVIHDWSTYLDEFKKGYDLDTVLQRLYIPVQLYYSPSLKKYTYDFHSFSSTGIASKIVFNLFELKIKPNITKFITNNGNTD